MNIASLLTPASNARASYQEGQQQGRKNKQQQQDDQLNKVLMMRKLQQDEERHRLAQALGQKTLNAPPAPVAPRSIDPLSQEGIAADVERQRLKDALKGPSSEPVEVTVGPDGKRIYTPRSKAAGMEAPAPSAGQSEDRTLVPVQQADGSVVYTPRADAIGKNAPAGRGGAQRPTEGQEKSHMFYNLMKNAEPEIGKLMATTKIRPAAVTAYLASQDAASIPLLGKLVGGLVSPAVNDQLNAEEQQLIRAGKDFTAGVLRKESGAAVSTRELIETMERYFPGMFGDKPELTAAKARARQQYMETMREQAMPASQYYERQEGTRRTPPPSATSSVTPAERDKLKAKGWTDAEIDAFSRTPDDE